jgi:GAF domain-containing protein
VTTHSVAPLSIRSLFISHASQDVELIEDLVQLLRVGIGLRDEEHFCTSLPGTSIPPGHDFVQRIRSELSETTLAIEIITPSYLESKFCLCELGALWFAMRDNIPVIVPPVSRRDLPEVLENIQAPYLADALDDIGQRVANAIGRSIDLPTWSRARTAFVNQLPSLLSRINAGHSVSREHHEFALQQLAEVRGRLEAVSEEYRRATALGEKLNYAIRVFPEILQQVNHVLEAKPEERQNEVWQTEYAVVYQAAHLYNREGLRAVVWRYHDGQFIRGGSSGWQPRTPTMSEARSSLVLTGPMRNFQDIWVDDPTNQIHQDSLPLGSGDSAFPSFLMVSLVAGERNLGVLHVEAPANYAFQEEDIRPVGAMAGLLAVAWAFVDPTLGVGPGDI